jgi:hypothetical protein
MSLARRTMSSCSHTRTTTQPADRSLASESWSRALFRKSFSFQYQLFTFGTRATCSGHPCQKHPSTKTATFVGPKTTSTRRRVPGTMDCSRRYRSPRRWSSRRSASSGAVSRTGWRCIRRRALGVVAKEFEVGSGASSLTPASSVGTVAFRVQLNLSQNTSLVGDWSRTPPGGSSKTGSSLNAVRGAPGRVFCGSERGLRLSG